MDCRDATERMSEYQDGLLSAAAAGDVSGHLRECGECAAAARSLEAVRELLRSLPPPPAPPELLARVREAVAREETGAASVAVGLPSNLPGGSLRSRLRIPLEAAAAVLLVASIYWYQKGSPPASRPQAPPAPPAVATSAPPPKTDRQTAGAETVARKREVASLPAGTPEPKARFYSQADLPAAPALRASTDSEQIASGVSAEARPAEERPEPPSRFLRPLPYGKEVLLEVTPEGREGVEERIAAAAWRLGGSVERIERDPAGGDVVSMRVLLKEPAATAFLSEMDRIGKVPPQEKPADVDLPAGPIPGTAAYTVRVRVR